LEERQLSIFVLILGLAGFNECDKVLIVNSNYISPTVQCGIAAALREQGFVFEFAADNDAKFAPASAEPA
jgi:hypothetical protein